MTPIPALDPVHVIIATPCAHDFHRIVSVLTHSNWRITHAATLGEAVAAATEHPEAPVLCAEHLPEGSWADLLDACPGAAVIVLSHTAGDSLWREVLCQGAYDLLAMPPDPEELFRVASLAWRHAHHAKGTAEVLAKAV